MRVTVRDGIGDLADDMLGIAERAPLDLARVVRNDAKEGNRIARAFASEQHTMHSDVDVPYQESFSAEERTPLSWEYGPVDDHVAHGGSQATGYEFGSRNQRPHLDIARSVDIIGPAFLKDVDAEVEDWFW